MAAASALLTHAALELAQVVDAVLQAAGNGGRVLRLVLGLPGGTAKRSGLGRDVSPRPSAPLW